MSWLAIFDLCVLLIRELSSFRASESVVFIQRGTGVIFVFRNVHRNASYRIYVNASHDR